MWLCGGGGGRGANKRITKGELIKPMEDLAKLFGELYEYIGDENVQARDYLTGIMTTTFKKIADIIKVNTEPVYDFETDPERSEHSDEEEEFVDDDDNEGGGGDGSSDGNDNDKGNSDGEGNGGRDGENKKVRGV